MMTNEGAATVAQSVRAFASREEGWVFESQTDYIVLLW